MATAARLDVLGETLVATTPTASSCLKPKTRASLRGVLTLLESRGLRPDPSPHESLRREARLQTRPTRLRRVNAAVADVKGVKERHLAIPVWLLQTPRPLPLKLEPGETWSGHLDPDWLREGVAEIAPGRSSWKVTVSVRDAADRLHDARPLTVS